MSKKASKSGKSAKSGRAGRYLTETAGDGRTVSGPSKTSAKPTVVSAATKATAGSIGIGGVGSTTSRKVSRADVRSAMIHGYRVVKSDPRSVKITTGQRRHVEEQAAS